MKIPFCDVARIHAIDAGGIGAELFAAVVKLNLDKGHHQLLVYKTRLERNRPFDSTDWLDVADIHLAGIAAGAQFLEDNPAGSLVYQGCLNAAVQSVNSPLEGAGGLPHAHYVIAVFGKRHPQTKRIVGAAAKAVVALYPCPRIIDFLHCQKFYSITNIAKDKKTTPGARQFRGWHNNANN